MVVREGMMRVRVLGRGKGGGEEGKEREECGFRSFIA